jgi:hypothetical protein
MKDTKRAVDAIFSVALLGPVLFVVTAFVLGAIEPGYSPVRNTISELALGSRGVVQTVNFGCCGILIAGLGVTVWGVGPPAFRGARYAAAAITLMGVVLVLSALIVTDPLHNADPTVEGMVHNGIFLVGMLGAISAQLVVGTSNLRSTYGIYSVLSGIASFVGLAGVIGLAESSGLAQRVLVVLVMLWITLAALRTKRTQRNTVTVSTSTPRSGRSSSTSRPPTADRQPGHTNGGRPDTDRRAVPGGGLRE